MLSGEIGLWTLAPRVRLFWGRVLGHVAQKHQSHFLRSSSLDDFDQRPPRFFPDFLVAQDRPPLGQTEGSEAPPQPLPQPGPLPSVAEQGIDGVGFTCN